MEEMREMQRYSDQSQALSPDVMENISRRLLADIVLYWSRYHRFCSEGSIRSFHFWEIWDLWRQNVRWSSWQDREILAHLWSTSSAWTCCGILRRHNLILFHKCRGTWLMCSLSKMDLAPHGTVIHSLQFLRIPHKSSFLKVKCVARVAPDEYWVSCC